MRLCLALGAKARNGRRTHHIDPLDALKIAQMAATSQQEDFDSYALLLAYDGKAYRGFARQPEKRTIEGSLRHALARILNEDPVSFRAASRTDSGVHALGQVISFRTRQRRDQQQLQRGLNAVLPPDLRILAAATVGREFDARRSASWKRYRYHIATARPISPFFSRYQVPVKRPLDAAAMRDAASRLIGPLDMRSFSAHMGIESPVLRRILSASVRSFDEGIVIEVQGDAFLRHAVRRIAGTLIEIGAGRLPPDAIVSIASSGDPRRAGPTAPAAGLFLWQVAYPKDLAPAFPSAPAKLLRFPGLDEQVP